MPDDETQDDVLDDDDITKNEREALAAEEAESIETLLARIRQLPLDSKFTSLKGVLEDLRTNGFVQAMVFTQYSDPMDFLRDELRKGTDLKIMSFYGRAGEVPSADGHWQRISRDDAKPMSCSAQTLPPSA